MSFRRVLFVALLAACGNNLPPPGDCVIPLASGEPVVTPVPLVGQAATFDDLHYSPALGKVLAAPEGVGRMFVVDPETLDVTTIGTSGGTASADADETTIYAIDRGNNRVVAYDATTGEMVTTLAHVMRGASLKAVQELLGHSSIQMTMRYAHLAPEVVNETVRLLDAPSAEWVAGRLGQRMGREDEEGR